MFVYALIYTKNVCIYLYVHILYPNLILIPLPGRVELHRNKELLSIQPRSTDLNFQVGSGIGVVKKLVINTFNGTYHSEYLKQIYVYSFHVIQNTPNESSFELY